MLKKIFIIVIIGVALLSSQFGCKQSTDSDVIKSEEIIIANSSDELKEFLRKNAISLKNHLREFPKKGEFETTEEFNKRLADLKEKSGIKSSIRYKAVALSPVEFGKYNADKELFETVSFRVSLPANSTVKNWDSQAVAILYKSRIGRMSTSRQGFTNFDIRCSREKAKILRDKIVEVICDIVFTLDYSHQTPSGAYRVPNWNLYKYWLVFWLQDIKFYHLDSGVGLAVPGEIIFQASGR